MNAEEGRDWQPIETAPKTWAYFEVCRSVFVNKITGDEPKRDFARYVPNVWEIKNSTVTMNITMQDDEFFGIYTHWRKAAPMPPAVKAV